MNVKLPPDVEAIVRLIPPEEGGRTTAAYSGYRPVHAVLPDYLTSGEHEYLDVDSLEPGGSARANIKFITPQYYPNCLTVGQVIRVQEGGRLIGHAEIIQIFNDDLRA